MLNANVHEIGKNTYYTFAFFNFYFNITLLVFKIISIHIIKTMKSKAILFGINYVNSPSARLRGCVNDVKNMGHFLKNTAKYDVVKIYTDEDNESKTRGHSIINSIYKLALDSHRFRLERVWIHFSGHGCGVYDRDGDEADGRDECIVPSDYHRVGIITDDLLKRVLRYFNKDTKVTCVFDCCHSGTIGDLKYQYVNDYHFKEVNTSSKCQSKVLLLSGCMDNQTSADAYNVRGFRQFSGAMTSCLLYALKKDNRALNVLTEMRKLLREKHFTQYPQMTSSFMVKDSDVLF